MTLAVKVVLNLYMTNNLMTLNIEKDTIWKKLWGKEKMLVTSIFSKMQVTIIFSPFPMMFSTLPEEDLKFWVTIILLSANAFRLDQSKILSFGRWTSIFSFVHLSQQISSFESYLSLLSANHLNLEGGKNSFTKQSLVFKTLESSKALENIVEKGGNTG